MRSTPVCSGCSLDSYGNLQFGLSVLRLYQSDSQSSIRAAKGEIGGESGIRTPDLRIMITNAVYKLLIIIYFILVCNKVCNDYLLIFGL